MPVKTKQKFSLKVLTIFSSMRKWTNGSSCIGRHRISFQMIFHSFHFKFPFFENVFPESAELAPRQQAPSALHIAYYADIALISPPDYIHQSFRVSYQ
jgi:hypothetical protein